MTQAPSIISGGAPHLWPEDVNFFLDLPLEVFQKHVVQELSLRVIGRLRQVCQPINELFQQDFPFWRPLLLRDFPLQMQEGAQAAYRRSHILRTNLIKGIFRSELYGIARIIHDFPSIGVVDGMIITGGFNNPIRIWNPDVKDLNEIPTMCMANIENRMVSFDDGEGSVKVIDIQEGRQLSLIAPPFFVVSLAYADGRLFCGDHAGNISIWDWATVQKDFQKYVEKGVPKTLILKEFKAHQSAVDALIVEGDTLISGGRDGTFRFWDLESYAFKEFSYPQSSTFTVAHGKLIVGMDNGQIEIIDIANRSVTSRFLGHPGTIENLFAVEDVFISEDQTERKIWDLSTGSCLATLSRGERPGRQYAYSEGKIVRISNVYEVRSEDYLASDDEIFMEIASLFRNGLDEYVSWAMHRFNKMPPLAREAIYLKFAEDYIQYADICVTLEQWFNDSKDNAGKAKAIEEYLAECKGSSA